MNPRTPGQPGTWPGVDGAALGPITRQPFRPKAARSAVPPLGFVFTTEVCELSCVMCHFNGPNAVRKAATLDPALVRKALGGRPPGEPVWFVATGDFFTDPNALLHLRTASDLGLVPRVITHGQRLTPAFIDEILGIGVREILISVDAIDPDRYARIRRGGRLDVILDALAHLRRRKPEYPDLRVGVTAICFVKQPTERSVVEEFWRSRADYVQFVSEVYDVFRFRRVFYLPQRRADCHVKLLPLPTGRVAPCCAVMIRAHEGDVSWLPHLAEDGPEEAYRKLCDLYDDPESPLGQICKTCDWWVQFQTDAGSSPIHQKVELGTSPIGPP
jgi:radical SAM family protein